MPGNPVSPSGKNACPRRKACAILATALLAIAGCGGGDGGDGGDSDLVPATPPELPFITVSVGTVSLFPIVTNPVRVFLNAQVRRQSAAGAPITTASLSVNGTALTFDITTGYSGTINANTGSAITIDAMVDGVPYTAATTLLSGPPRITAPDFNTWDATLDNSIQWTNAPGSDAFGVTVAVFSGPTRVWPSAGLQTPILSGMTSVVVPRNTLSPCNCTVNVSAFRLSTFPGAATGSNVNVSAQSTTLVTVVR